MNWYKIAKTKSKFNFSRQIKDIWRQLILDAQDKFRILFDLENDDNITDEKTITIDGTKDISGKPYKIIAQLCQAGGDWQNPVAYFRCQIDSSFPKSFVFIPSNKEGNNNLVSTMKNSRYNFVASDHKHDNEQEIDERKCWKALKDYVTKNIENINQEIQDSFKIVRRETNLYDQRNREKKL